MHGAWLDAADGYGGWNVNCAACDFPTDQDIRCGCGAVFCTHCHGEHECATPATQFARAKEPQDAMDLARAFNLRPYQNECIDRIFEELADKPSTLAVLPTGCGKTVIFGNVAHDWPGDLDDSDGRILILAHREELISQAADKVSRITGEQVDIEMGERFADEQSLHARARIVVSSIQTQQRRMQRFNPNDFGLVIVDEAHHAPADTYRRTLEYYRQNPSCKVLGVTATPDRADELALGQIFESVAYDYQLPDAIDDGWLVPIEQQFVTVDGLDFSGCRTTAGDLNNGDVDAIVRQEEMLHKFVDPTVALAGDMPTLVFGASVAHAHLMAEIFNRHKPDSAVALDGKTPAEERREQLARFHRGEYQFLCNCGLFLEGFDEPRIGVVAVARPTKSRSLYAQVVGRGTRTLPGCIDGLGTAAERKAAIAASGKPGVLVLDFVGNSGRHKLISTADILGGDLADDIVERARTIAAQKSARGEKQEMLAAIKQAEEEEIERKRKIRQQVIGKADFRTRKVSPFDLFDVRPVREPAWHKGRKPSDKQKAVLAKAGIAEREIEGMSFVQASSLIDTLMARRREDKCSYKQAKLLASKGMDPNVSFAEARRLIDQLAANNWQPLGA